MSRHNPEQEQRDVMDEANREIETPRLFIRTLRPPEIPQYRIIRSDPSNNRFGGIDMPEADEDDLLADLENGEFCQQIQLVVVLKTDHTEDELSVEGGRLIGYIDGTWDSPARGGDMTELGGYIHYPFRKKGYAREAFRAVFDYELCDPGLSKQLVLETKVANLPFRGLMRCLGLKRLEEPGSLWKDEGLPDESVKYIFGRGMWEQAKRDVVNGRVY
jgi:RimJ/RimL family protein N-acetyltransferase